MMNFLVRKKDTGIQNGGNNILKNQPVKGLVLFSRIGIDINNVLTISEIW